MPKYPMKPEDEPMQYCGYCGLPCVDGDFCDRHCHQLYKEYMEDINQDWWFSWDTKKGEGR